MHTNTTTTTQHQQQQQSAHDKRDKRRPDPPSVAQCTSQGRTQRVGAAPATASVPYSCGWKAPTCALNRTTPKPRSRSRVTMPFLVSVSLSPSHLRFRPCCRVTMPLPEQRQHWRRSNGRGKPSREPETRGNRMRGRVKQGRSVCWQRVTCTWATWVPRNTRVLDVAVGSDGWRG